MATAQLSRFAGVIVYISYNFYFIFHHRQKLIAVIPCAEEEKPLLALNAPIEFIKFMALIFPFHLNDPISKYP